MYVYIFVMLVLRRYKRIYESKKVFYEESVVCFVRYGEGGGIEVFWSNWEGRNIRRKNFVEC